MFVSLFLCVCACRTSVLSEGLGFNISSLSSLNINITSPGETFSLYHNSYCISQYDIIHSCTITTLFYSRPPRYSPHFCFFCCTDCDSHCRYCCFVYIFLAGRKRIRFNIQNDIQIICFEKLNIYLYIMLGKKRLYM